MGGIQFVFTLPPSAEEVQETGSDRTPGEEIDIETHILPEKTISKASKPGPLTKKLVTKKEPLPPGLEKPPYSYAVLIAEAINSTSDRRMTLSEIYQYIAMNYEYYQYANNGWQVGFRVTIQVSLI